MGINSLQVLRGLLTQWLSASLIWMLCAHPIDALVRHAGERGQYVKCLDPALDKAFRPTVARLRHVSGDKEAIRLLTQ